MLERLGNYVRDNVWWRRFISGHWFNHHVSVVEGTIQRVNKRLLDERKPVSTLHLLWELLVDRSETRYFLTTYSLFINLKKQIMSIFKLTPRRFNERGNELVNSLWSDALATDESRKQFLNAEILDSYVSFPRTWRDRATWISCITSNKAQPQSGLAFAMWAGLPREQFRLLLSSLDLNTSQSCVQLADALDYALGTNLQACNAERASLANYGPISISHYPQALVDILDRIKQAPALEQYLMLKHASETITAHQVIPEFQQRRSQACQLIEEAFKSAKAAVNVDADHHNLNRIMALYDCAPELLRVDEFDFATVFARATSTSLLKMIEDRSTPVRSAWFDMLSCKGKPVLLSMEDSEDEDCSLTANTDPASRVISLLTKHNAQGQSLLQSLYDCGRSDREYFYEVISSTPASVMAEIVERCKHEDWAQHVLSQCHDCHYTIRHQHYMAYAEHDDAKLIVLLGTIIKHAGRVEAVRMFSDLQQTVPGNNILMFLLNKSDSKTCLNLLSAFIDIIPKDQWAVWLGSHEDPNSVLYKAMQVAFAEERSSIKDAARMIVSSAEEAGLIQFSEKVDRTLIAGNRNSRFYVEVSRRTETTDRPVLFHRL